MDTVTIRITYPDFTVTHPEYFSPRVKLNRNEQIDREARPKDVYKIFTQHQTKEDKVRNIYKPVLTLTQRMKQGERELEWFLNIQMSVPRILYPSNIYEIVPQDRNRIFRELVRILSIMGIETQAETISESVVTKFHTEKTLSYQMDIQCRRQFLS